MQFIVSKKEFIPPVIAPDIIETLGDDYEIWTYEDFQYSDFWADPAKQYAPKEWKNYSNSKKISSIYQFTFSSLKTLIDSGINVGMVQIGNETNGSMCGMGGLYDGVWKCYRKLQEQKEKKTTEDQQDRKE